MYANRLAGCSATSSPKYSRCRRYRRCICWASLSKWAFSPCGTRSPCPTVREALIEVVRQRRGQGQPNIHGRLRLIELYLQVVLSQLVKEPILEFAHVLTSPLRHDLSALQRGSRPFQSRGSALQRVKCRLRAMERLGSPAFRQ